MMQRIAMAACLLATGCASHGYRCPEPEACDPVRDNYIAAVTDDGWDGWKAERAGKKASGQETTENLTAAVEGSPDTAAVKPVYVPPHPWRVWLAPYSRDDGTLESGTYVWFTTPGYWLYLGKRWTAPPFSGRAGDGGSDLAPVSPQDLGFSPGKPLAPQGVLQNIPQPDPGKGG